MRRNWNSGRSNSAQVGMKLSRMRRMPMYWCSIPVLSPMMQSGKSRRLMHRLYRENPAAKLVVSGCYASLQADEVAHTLGVDLVVPNTEKDQLPQTVMQRFELPVMPAMATEPGEAPLFLRGRHRAFIKIQDGCRYRCTFCIVTVARGDERSRTEADIISEINTLHQQGIQEIVLGWGACRWLWQ